MEHHTTTPKESDQDDTKGLAKQKKQDIQFELGLALQDCLQSQEIQEEEHYEVMKYITNPANMSKLWKKLIPDEDPANDLCD